MKKVGVICGGFSSEFDISLLSGETIVKNFPTNYQAYRVVLEKNDCFIELENTTVPLALEDLSYQHNGQRHQLDYALIYIHGNPGENGKLQAFFDMKGVPYINSGALASELSFDKWYCNQFLKSFGIDVAKSTFYTQREGINEEKLIDDLGLPVFVKPCDSGSSYGISRVNQLDQLGIALDKAFAEGRTVVVESFLAGTEVTCGVYGTKKGVHALPLTEIASHNEYFDYEAKYLGQSEEITPARISKELTEKVQEISKKIYTLLGLRSIARIDFMLVKDVPYIIEVNTTPGFSPASLVPQMIACEGKTISAFWQEIMETFDA